MKKINEEDILSAVNFIGNIAEEINSLPKIKLSELEPSSTAFAAVDIINGFIREGAMSSSDIESIIDPSVRLLSECKRLGMPCIAFADCHEKGCAEFDSFPEHCVKNTSESELVDELKAVGGYTLIEKNSTNGCHEKAFYDFLEQHKGINTFIVCGDCTDICVMQFCLSLKTLFNKENMPLRIVVPVNAVETYDAPQHNAVFANISAYKLMKDCGICFVSEII